MEPQAPQVPKVPPKVVQLHPQNIGIEIEGDAVTLIVFLPLEVMTVSLSLEAWKALNAEVTEKTSGIVVPQPEGIVLP